MVFVAIVVGLLGLIIGAAAAWLVFSRIKDTKGRDERLQAQADAEKIIEAARAQERELTLSAKDEALRLREEIEREQKEQRANIQRQERRIQQKEETLDRKTAQLEQRDA